MDNRGNRTPLLRAVLHSTFGGERQWGTRLKEDNKSRHESLFVRPRHTCARTYKSTDNDLSCPFVNKYFTNEYNITLRKPIGLLSNILC